MAAFGMTAPVLVAAHDRLIEGHGRVPAAAHLGLHEVPVIVPCQPSEAQYWAYRIAIKNLTAPAGSDAPCLCSNCRR